jgi:hypothetical protein
LKALKNPLIEIIKGIFKNLLFEFNRIKAFSETLIPMTIHWFISDLNLNFVFEIIAQVKLNCYEDFLRKIINFVFAAF